MPKVTENQERIDIQKNIQPVDQEKNQIVYMMPQQEFEEDEWDSGLAMRVRGNDLHFTGSVTRQQLKEMFIKIKASCSDLATDYVASIKFRVDTQIILIEYRTSGQGFEIFPSSSPSMDSDGELDLDEKEIFFALDEVIDQLATRFDPVDRFTAIFVDGAYDDEWEWLKLTGALGQSLV